MSTIESPGSLNQFREAYPDKSKEEVTEEYYSALSSYRRDLAEQAGITVEDLHERGTSITDAILREAGVEQE